MDTVQVHVLIRPTGQDLTVSLPLHKWFLLSYLELKSDLRLKLFHDRQTGYSQSCWAADLSCYMDKLHTCTCISILLQPLFKIESESFLIQIFPENPYHCLDRTLAC